MIFYLVEMSDGSKLLTKTQAEAKSFKRPFSQFDLATDKDGLLAFAQDALNQIFQLEHKLKTATEGTKEADLEANLSATNEELIEQAQPLEVPWEEAAPVPVIMPSNNLVLTAQTVSTWLQDVATQAQIESVFQSLGCRFGEAIRKDRD